MRAAAIALGTLVLAAALQGGCAELRQAPYNGRLSCDGVGGLYTADGRCVGGSASLEVGAGAGGTAPGTLELELGYGGTPPLDLPLAAPDVNADAEQALQELRARRQAGPLGQDGRPDPTRRPDLDHDITQGSQSRGLDRAIGR